MIYQGGFTKGRTDSVGLLLYPSGDIYFGQIRDFEKHGAGKLVEISGSYCEGTWSRDKLHGEKCKIHDVSSNNYFIGGVDYDKKSGTGIFFNQHDNTIYEGSFANDKMNGEGMLYTTNGSIIKGWFRNDQLEGEFTLVDENLPAKQF